MQRLRYRQNGQKSPSMKWSRLCLFRLRRRLRGLGAGANSPIFEPLRGAPPLFDGRSRFFTVSCGHMVSSPGLYHVPRMGRRPPRSNALDQEVTSTLRGSDADFRPAPFDHAAQLEVRPSAILLHTPTIRPQPPMADSSLTLILQMFRRRQRDRLAHAPQLRQRTGNPASVSQTVTRTSLRQYGQGAIVNC